MQLHVIPDFLDHDHLVVGPWYSLDEDFLVAGREHCILLFPPVSDAEDFLLLDELLFFLFLIVWLILCSHADLLGVFDRSLVSFVRVGRD